jgi:cell division protein WhiA
VRGWTSRSALVEVLDVRPVVSRRQGGNLSGSDAYLVEVGRDALHPLGVIDDHGRPREGIGEVALDVVPAYVAGALMVAGTLSGVGAPVHLEITAPGTTTAQGLGALVGGTVSGTRIVLKHGDAVGDLLASVGAFTTFLAFDQGRMRRDLRRQVTRSVNADRANLRRTADAAQGQIAAIRELLDVRGIEGIPEDLRDVALARVANPEASLADLGRLLDPPIGKATVHRRLARLQAEGAEGDGRGSRGPGQVG